MSAASWYLYEAYGDGSNGVNSVEFVVLNGLFLDLQIVFEVFIGIGM